MQLLESTLTKIRAVTKGSMGLTSVSNQIKKIADASASLSENGIKKVSNLATALSKLNGIGEVRISASIGRQLSNIADAAVKLQSADLTKLTQLADSVRPLSTLSGAHLTSYINQLGKLPQVIDDLHAADLDRFIDEVNRLNTALQPFASTMDRISNGFSAFPARIQRLVQSTEQFNETMNRANRVTRAGRENGLWGFLNSAHSRYVALAGLYGAIAHTLGGFVEQAAGYSENLNLFTVAMGKYAEEAYSYAESVQAALGIDMSEWMRNQGIFMQIATGFGVIEEKAYTMSQGLTQIAYDIASFYNISTEEAMQKVQSGISGELEPLRRLGYALDAATLQQIAYDNGIEQNINTMTQAQKSQLRYVAIMEQSTNAMGDMARTIMSPANALRVVNMQLEQLQRAMGNAILPLLMELLPYAQAAIVVLTDAINKLAVLFGFELPEIDYSTLGGLQSGAEDATGAIGDTTEAVQELKNAMLGIDELNVISPNAAADNTIGGAYDLPLNIDSYKFFDEGYENQVNKIADGIRKMFEPIGEFFDKLYDKSNKLFESLGFDVDNLDLTKITKAATEALKGFGIDVDKINVNFGKTKIGTVTGEDHLRENIIGGALGASLFAGGALALMKGGAGGLLKYGLGLALSITAIDALYDDAVATCDSSESNGLLRSLTGALQTGLMGATLSLISGKGLTFAVGVGLTITALEVLFDEVVSSADGSESNGFIQSLRGGLMVGLLGAGLSLISGKGVLFAVGVGLTITSLKLLYDNIMTEADSSAANGLLLALQKAFSLSLLGSGLTLIGGGGLRWSVAIGLALATVSLVYDGVSMLFDSDKNNDLLASVSLAISTALGGVALTMATGASLSYTFPMILGFSSLVFSFTSAAGVASSDSPKDALIPLLAQFLSNMLGGISLARALGTSVSSVLAWTIPITIALDISFALNKVGALDSIQTYLDESFATLREKASGAFETELQGETWVEKTLDAVNRAGQVAGAALETAIEGASDLGKKLVDTVTGAVDYPELGEASKGIGSNVVDGFVEGVEEKTFDAQKKMGEFADKIKSKVTDILGIHSPSTVFKEYAQFVIEGFVEGIKEYEPNLHDQMRFMYETLMENQAGFNDLYFEMHMVFTETMMESITMTLTTLRIMNDDFYAYLENTFASYTATHLSDTAIFQQNVITSYSSFYSTLRSNFDSWSSSYLSAARAFVNTLNSIMSGVGSPGATASLSLTSSLGKVKAFASGGYPDEGSLFIARERGAEMVGSIGGRTAVANNDQIVEAIRQGVYDAEMAARSQDGGGDTFVYLDSDQISARVEKRRRESGMNIFSGGVVK